MSPNPPQETVVTPGQDPGTTLPGALELVLLRVKGHAQRRRLWLRELLERERMEGGAEASYHRLIESILAGRDNLADEAVWQEANPELAALNAEIDWATACLDVDQSSRLAGLVANFGLHEHEVAVLHTCIALAMEPQLERVWSYLQDHNGRGFVTLALVTKLFGMQEALIGSDLPALKTWRFVREIPGSKGEPSQYELDPWVFNWLRGQNRIDPVLMGKASFPALRNQLENWPVEAVVAEIARIVEVDPHRKVRLVVRGPEGSGRQTFATLVAGRFGLPVMSLDLSRIAPEEWPTIHLHAQRQAFLNGFALCWRGDDLADRHWPQDVVPVQLQFAVLERGQVLHPQGDVVDLKQDLAPLTIALRRSLWQSLVPTSAGWDAEAMEDLVLRYPTTVGQIAMVGARAAMDPAGAIEIMRDASRHRLGKLAQLLPAHFHWDDLSLHPILLESLKDFVYEARERETIWEVSAAKRLFPQGKGLMALFSGPSGTGKTMTAQVIAASLQQDLFRVDLSTVISKYVGETSKHIDRILSQAQAMHAVLLFDEADTLFGKRTDIKDAHDRFANADTNYLLQAIESYPGVAILATNRKANIDTAFVRRLRFVFEFSKPDASQRLQLWHQLLGELAGGQAVAGMGLALQQVAGMLDLTGAQIKYAVLSALFVARREGKPLAITHVLKGIERELAKEGKGLSPETEKRLGIFKH